MKNLRLSWFVPLFAFLAISTGCTKTSDLSNKTSLTVSCEVISTQPGEGQLGSEVSMIRVSDGHSYKQFAIVPGTVKFDNVEPGTYEIKGENSPSLDRPVVHLEQNDQKVAALKFP
jgi:hypothetical protein